jgi:hypothetical protein
MKLLTFPQPLLRHYMIRICQDCNSRMGETPCEPAQHLKLTHGICPDCLAMFKQRLEASRQRKEVMA